MRDETTFDFSGPFRDVMPLYIKYRRSLGYKVAESELYRMKELDVFFERHGITEPCLPREMYDKWTSLRDGERPVTVCRRQAFIRGLGRYMSAAGYQDIYTGEDDKRCFESDYIPYIFTHTEIKRIFSEMDSICLKKPSFLNHSFRLVVSLCYCCGLRKAEAVSLKIKDIDFQTGKINILNSKRNVSRMIVASGSLLKTMKKYHNDFCNGYGQDDWLIQNSKGGVYCKNTLYKLYHELLEKADIPARSDGRIHRLHDMRHTFCVHTLEQMQTKGFDLYTSLSLLSAYLGHKHVTETEYYLRLVEEYHDSVLDQVAQYCQSVFPEEVADDED